MLPPDGHLTSPIRVVLIDVLLDFVSADPAGTRRHSVYLRHAVDEYIRVVPYQVT